LATSAGIRITTSANPTSSGNVRGIYKKHTFSITGEGRLEQIAEFLRRFHRTEYLHQIQSFGPRPVANQPGMFNVTFRVEALSLPQVNLVNVPNSGSDASPMTDDERQMLTTIRERAALSAYTPPPPPRPTEPAPPPPPRFDDVPYCYLIAVTEADGKPQCWINHRTTGRTYYLFEDGSFMLRGIRCVVKKIEIDNERVWVDIGGGLYTIKVGKNFDEIEAVE
jgi:hypothetical protein